MLRPNFCTLFFRSVTRLHLGSRLLQEHMSLASGPFQEGFLQLVACSGNQGLAQSTKGGMPQGEASHVLLMLSQSAGGVCRRQAVAGLPMAGAWTSATYVWAKMRKAWHARS